MLDSDTISNFVLPRTDKMHTDGQLTGVYLLTGLLLGLIRDKDFDFTLTHELDAPDTSQKIGDIAILANLIILKLLWKSK